MNEKPLIDLNKTQWLSIWWAFLWRGLITTIGTFFVSLFVGFVLGLLAAIIVVPLKIPKLYWFIPLQTVSFIIGLFFGFVAFMIFLRWLFAARVFGYRFALVEATEQQVSVASSVTSVSATPAEINEPST